MPMLLAALRTGDATVIATVRRVHPASKCSG
jgi:hypothetical protein